MQAAGRSLGSLKYLPALQSLKDPMGTGRLREGSKGGTRSPSSTDLIQFYENLVTQTHRCSLHMRHQEISPDGIYIHSKGMSLQGKGPKGALDTKLSL